MPSKSRVSNKIPQCCTNPNLTPIEEEFTRYENTSLMVPRWLCTSCNRATDSDIVKVFWQGNNKPHEKTYEDVVSRLISY